MAVARNDQYLLTIYVGGRKIGTFDDWDGGAVDSQEKKYRPGGMGRQVSLGGQQMIDNITVTVGYDRQRDAGQIRFLLNGVGIERSEAYKQPLDIRGLPFGDPLVYQGVLKKFTPSNVQADGNDTDTFALEVSTDGEIG